MGTEYAMTTDRFQEAKFHWPLFGNESWKATVASVSIAVVWRFTIGCPLLNLKQALPTNR